MNTITRQNLVYSYDKNKNIVIQSIKKYTDDTKKIHKAVLSKATIKNILASKDYNTVAKILKAEGTIQSLKLDSQAKKEGIAKNTGYCTTRDGLIKFLTMPKIAYHAPEAKVKKAVTKKAVKKVTAKKAKAKKAVKK